MPSTSPASNAARFTLLDEGRTWSGEVALEGETLWLTPQALHAATGWELKPHGVCRDDVCIPASADPRLVAVGRVNVSALAKVLERPLVLDAEARVAFLGASARKRADRLASLEAPDFVLPDLNGQPHSLSEQRGKKVLLAAYASW
jgi:hypothetical protein